MWNYSTSNSQKPESNDQLKTGVLRHSRYMGVTEAVFPRRVCRIQELVAIQSQKRAENLESLSSNPLIK